MLLINSLEMDLGENVWIDTKLIHTNGTEGT